MELRRVSIKTIIQAAITNLGLGDREIPVLDMIEWIAWGLQQIGAYSQYIEKHNVSIEIDNHRATLPSDFYQVLPNPGLTYKLTGDMISVPQKNGCISINYLAFEVDEDGYPLIPDHASYQEALVWLIAYRLSVRDQLPNKKLDIAYCSHKWNFYCKQARSKGQKLDEDGKIRFAKMFLGLRSNLSNYSTNINSFKLDR